MSRKRLQRLGHTSASRRSVRSRLGGLLNAALRPFGIELARLQSDDIRYAWLRSLGIDTVLDIGAHKGEFAALIRSILPRAMIYSFEPLTTCFEELVRSMGRDSRFRALNMALGAHEGESTFHESAWSPSSSLLEMTELHKRAFPHTGEHTTTFVSVKRLDDVAPSLDLGSHILVKIDVQGAEDHVLSGGEQTILAADLILIETSFLELYKGQMLFNDIAEYLNRLGFKYMGSFGPSARHPIDGSNLYEDSIFIKRSFGTRTL